MVAHKVAHSQLTSIENTDRRAVKGKFSNIERMKRGFAATSVGAWLARDGVLEDAIAGKPCSYRLFNRFRG
jgi:hypothetical protein